MAQKINPISLRLGKTNRNFDSSWFNDSNYVNLLMRDLTIQWYINLILKKLKYCSARYLIQNLPNKVKINIFFCNPDKSRRHISKIFYLNHTKKIKKSKKKFFNVSQNGFSYKQSKIFQYLIKNFNNNLLKTVDNLPFGSQLPIDLVSKTKSSSLVTNNQVLLRYCVTALQRTILFDNNSTNLNKNIDNLNNIILFKNYLKLIFSIKKYNQFYIRYFLIKYFSSKFPIISFNEKKNYLCSISPTYETSSHITQDLSLNTFFTKTEIENKQKQNILFFHIMNFFFFKIHKNKNFLALNYFQIKKDNYKKIKNKIKNDGLNLKVKTKKKNDFLFKVILNNFICPDLNLNLSTIFFFNNVEITKLKILNFLKKLESESKYLLGICNLNKINSNLVNSNMINKPEKNFILAFNQFNNFIQLKDNYKNLQWCHNKNDLINCVLDQKSLNQKYYNISLLNNQCLNNTYTHYCKLSESYKYYNNIFSQYNLNCSDIFIKNNKKLTLISSPYKHHMESVICNHLSSNINFNFFQTVNIFQNASFFIDEIIYYLEKRIAFFKIKNYILKKLTEQKFLHIKGIRVTCSGRIGGKSKKAQRSKIQNFKYGETSLHVFSSKIDFKSKNAFTSFGTLGVKTWICYN